MGTAISARRHIVTAAALAVGAGLLLTGCGGQPAAAAPGSGDGAAPGTPSASSAPETTAPTADPTTSTTSSRAPKTTRRPKGTTTRPRSTATNPGDVVLDEGRTMRVKSVDLEARTAVATGVEMMSGSAYCTQKKLSADHEECSREWITVDDPAGPQTLKLSAGATFYLDLVAPQCEATEQECLVPGKDFAAALEDGELLAAVVTAKGEVTAMAQVYTP